MPQAIDRLLATPMINPRLPAINCPVPAIEYHHLLGNSR
jgi:hypothetical protein